VNLYSAFIVVYHSANYTVSIHQMAHPQTKVADI